MFRSVILMVFIISIIMVSGCNQKNSTIKINPADNETVVENQTFVWKESSPAKQGVDDQVLQSIEDEIKVNYAKLLSVVIVKNDHIIFERYYQDRDKDTYTNVFSVNKSILSALTGIAFEMDFLSDLDQSILGLLPKYTDDLSGSQKQEITIRNLLTMTGGLDSVDKDIGSWFYSKDWLASALDQHMTHKPGETFVYNTGLSHILSGVLTEATGMTTKDFADQYLFGPLNITNYKWDKAPEGTYVGGTNLYMTPRDMAKFGYLFLNNGLWEEEQVVPQDWVKAASQAQFNESNYGYLFSMKNIKDTDGRELFTYEASGHGGQHIRIIPELDSVIVITSDHLSQIPSNTRQLIEMHIIPALY